VTWQDSSFNYVYLIKGYATLTNAAVYSATGGHVSEFEAEKAWFGAGIKGGGTVFVVGMEGFEGVMWNSNHPEVHNEFNITSVRLGLGLGGGAGLSLLCAYNINGSMWGLQGHKITDWGVNFALGEKWSAIVKALRLSGFLKVALTVAKAKKVTGLTPVHFEQARNLAHYLWDVGEMVDSDGPTFVTIDTPLSAGAELSAHYTIGSLAVA
jgi:hypothetical protein